jgi:hypothetical protein
LPNFEVDEMVIHHGVSRFSTLIERRLQQDISNAAIENASLNQKLNRPPIIKSNKKYIFLT